ncbi:MAG: hypothetical protein F6K44_00980 [Moorea sp. SIO3E2]|nr:hypothetical protein [Moorena sp. SIO3E2]
MKKVEQVNVDNVNSDETPIILSVPSINLPGVESSDNTVAPLLSDFTDDHITNIFANEFYEQENGYGSTYIANTLGKNEGTVRKKYLEYCSEIYRERSNLLYVNKEKSKYSKLFVLHCIRISLQCDRKTQLVTSECFFLRDETNNPVLVINDNKIGKKQYIKNYLANNPELELKIENNSIQLYDGYSQIDTVKVDSELDSRHELSVHRIENLATNIANLKRIVAKAGALNGKTIGLMYNESLNQGFANEVERGNKELGEIMGGT